MEALSAVTKGDVPCGRLVSSLLQQEALLCSAEADWKEGLLLVQTLPFKMVVRRHSCSMRERGERIHASAVLVCVQV